jgi:Fe-S-cluster containining protein
MLGGDLLQKQVIPMAAANCSSCAAQCCRLTVVLGASDCVPAHLTTELPTGLRVMAGGADGWCVALDRERMNCSIYDDRPQTCRRFAMSGPYCSAIFAGDKGTMAPSTP